MWRSVHVPTHHRAGQLLFHKHNGPTSSAVTQKFTCKQSKRKPFMSALVFIRVNQTFPECKKKKVQKIPFVFCSEKDKVIGWCSLKLGAMFTSLRCLCSLRREVSRVHVHSSPASSPVNVQRAGGCGPEEAILSPRSEASSLPFMLTKTRRGWVSSASVSRALRHLGITNAGEDKQRPL